MNLHLYPSSVESVLATDAAPAMVAEASRKATDPRVSVAVATVESAEGGYDTVVDTFGLCSVEDPVEALRAMARAAAPGGRVLLLEHGRSRYEWLNRVLDAHAAAHLKRWGCSWNRDYDGVVAAAGLAGHVEVARRFHFGTTYFFVVRAPAAADGDADDKR